MEVKSYRSVILFFSRYRHILGQRNITTSLFDWRILLHSDVHWLQRAPNSQVCTQFGCPGALSLLPYYIDS
jgi:hypothetical protein